MIRSHGSFDNGCGGPCCAQEGVIPKPSGRLEPQVEHLVRFAQELGFLRSESGHSQNRAYRAEEDAKKAREETLEAQRRLRWVKDDLEEVAKERDSALRKVPKKPTKVTKKAKK